MGPAPTLVWFRRDLRIADNPALRDAVEAGPVVCLWVADPGILGRRHHAAPARLRFLRAGLEALDAALRDRGSRLVVRTGVPEEVIPAVAAECGAGAVRWAREVSPLGRARDARVAGALERAGVTAIEDPGDLVAEPEDLPGSSGEGYLVFTPFSRAWMEVPLPPHRPAPRRVDGPELPSDGLGALPDGDPLIPAGPDAARRVLVDFITRGAADRYGTGRDAVAADGTSRLSAYLRFGMVTGAQIGRALGLPDEISAGRMAFWRQVCWREFYHHHLRRHPEVARMALRPKLRDVLWDHDPELLRAWRDGRTGYPFVDAGMRQLAAEGWVHNRARMVVASFLVKDLLIDWRVGETVFMQGLLDGDPANNNGGWQWTAGTGTDAAPWFRVFNPVLQGRRFDPHGAYVRRWVPELRDVPDDRVHEPWRMSDDQQRRAGCVLGGDYPHRVVDHAERRGAALERYRAAAGAAPR
ncbi:MAG: deoxyribodipyrimidine photo-lyase [Thermoleophilia bacterium]|nr:deoxyribodipyrimidine photo-lyase [Thermoleophilia bacterium]